MTTQASLTLALTVVLLVGGVRSDARGQCGGEPAPLSQPRPTTADLDGPPPPPPGTEKVVNYDRRGDVVAACALKAGADVAHSKRTIRPTEVWITNGRDVWKTATGLGTCDPAWSPDGTRLAVAAPDGIWLLSGQNQQQGERFTDIRMAEDPAPQADGVGFSKPRWSPDGRKLAAVVDGGGTTWIEVMDVQTGKRLFKSDTGRNEYSWEPDSASITIAGKTARLAK